MFPGDSCVPHTKLQAPVSCLFSTQIHFIDREELPQQSDPTSFRFLGCVVLLSPSEEGVLGRWLVVLLRGVTKPARAACKFELPWSLFP